MVRTWYFILNESKEKVTCSDFSFKRISLLWGEKTVRSRVEARRPGRMT